MKTKHGVAIQYGKSAYKLTASDLQLIADALESVNPDSSKLEKRARVMSSAFQALAEYAKTI